jgi:hypothetical protein
MSIANDSCQTITVTVYSALAYPWYYVGQKLLQLAILQFQSQQDKQQKAVAAT